MDLLAKKAPGPAHAVQRLRCRRGVRAYDAGVGTAADQTVERALEGACAWAGLAPEQRRRMRTDLLARVDAHAQEWTSGPWAKVHYIRALAGTLARMGQDKSTVEELTTRRVVGDRVVVEVL